MPEYLAPGVYVEEVSFRSKSIEGVGTTTTGFVGPARYGATDLPPEIITSLGEFELSFGDRQRLDFGGTPSDNYLWHAARAFFQEGGQRLYVSRIFHPYDDTETPPTGMHRDGVANAGVDASGVLNIQARFPGAAGNMRVRLTLRLGQNVLAQDTGPDGSQQPVARGLLDKDVVLVNDIKSPILSPLEGGAFALGVWDETAQDWKFRKSDGTEWRIMLSGSGYALIEVPLGL